MDEKKMRMRQAPLHALMIWAAVLAGPAEAAAGVAREPHLVASLRLRGGKMASSSGVPGAVGGAGDVASAQGVQLPLLRNILDMTTSITAANNGSNTSGSTAGLDPERMAFLQNAFTELLENTTDAFATAISRLHLPEESEENVLLKQRALAEIAERTESMDLAEGLLNMGGLGPAIECLASDFSTTRERAADVVAAAVQNLDKLREAAHGLGALDALIRVYSNRSEVPETRAKSLHAISALIRGNSSAELSFLYNQGLGLLRCDMQIGDVRVRRKALFVLSQLLRSNPLLRAAVAQVQRADNGTADKGVLPELVQVMTIGPEGAPDPQMVEFAISALVSSRRRPCSASRVLPLLFDRGHSLL